MKKVKQRIDESFVMELFTVWFFGEVAFVVLPLLVIFAVRSLLGVELDDIFLLPDWSFASIVILASALNRFIEFKTSVQGDQSNRTYSGVRFIVLLLIAAVLTLALAVAHQHGVVLKEAVLASAQLLQFLLSLLVCLSFIYYPLDLEWRERHLSKGINFRDLRRAVRRSLRDADRAAKYIERAVRHYQDSPEGLRGDPSLRDLITEQDEVTVRRLASLGDFIREAKAQTTTRAADGGNDTTNPASEQHEAPNPDLKRAPDGAA